MMSLDILAFGAHPDDVELGCSGMLSVHIKKGYKVGIIDLTRGELGSRGSSTIREQESKASSDLLNVSIRENLEFSDGFFIDSKENKLEIIKLIRKYRPKILLFNAPYDRHPDHARAFNIQNEANFLAGLNKIETKFNGSFQSPWRAKLTFNYIQSTYIEPDFIVDISDSWHIKEKAIKCFKSQFYDSKSIEPLTYISTPDFMRLIESRAQQWGHSIGVKYGEGFLKNQNLGIQNIFDLI